MSNEVFILDSTLRDGAQGQGISFSVEDKLKIAKALDDLGVHYVEAGNPDGAQALKATDNTGLKIWEPNYDVHTASGVQNAALYGISTTQTGGTQLKYYGIKADIADGVDPYKNFDQPPTNANFTDMSGSGFMIYSPATGIPTTAYLNVFTLQPGITKVIVFKPFEPK